MTIPQEPYGFPNDVLGIECPREHDSDRVVHGAACGDSPGIDAAITAGAPALSVHRMQHRYLSSQGLAGCTGSLHQVEVCA